MPEYQGTYNGVTWGAGSDYEVTRFVGMFVRQVDILTAPLPRYHGGIVGASYETARVLELDFEVWADTDDELVTLLDDLYEAFGPQVDTELPLVFTLPGQAARRILCRPAEGLTQMDVEFGAAVALAPMRLIASDPAIYADSLLSSELAPFAASAGLSYPVTYPKSYGAGGSGAGTTVTNAGRFETWPTFAIAGPSSGTLTDPIVENVTTGKKIALTAFGGVSIVSGQTLLIDTHPARRTIAFDTGASRYGNLSDDSEFFPLAPGDNELRFRASGTTTGATCTVSARSAWI